MEQPINILIVDDDPRNLTVLETVLDNPGYRLIRAESADQALLALVREEFALLILDVRMPDMTGFELAHLIKERQKTAGVPIIFLTAYYNEDQHVLTDYGAGAVDYLPKPVNPTVLRSKVAVFAELHHKNRALLAEVADRRLAEEQLRELNATLEQRVTERTEALRDSEERFRMVADNMSQFAWTADPTGWIFWYNRRWYDYTGTTFEEMQGWGWQKVHHPDHVHRVVVHIQRSWDTGEPWEDTFPLRGKDGNYRRFLSRALPIRDAEGRIVRWFGTNTDITELREIQASLRESEDRFHTLADNISQFVWMADAVGRRFWYNRRWYEYTGATPEEMQGRGWEKAHHPDHLDRVVEKWRHVHATGEPWEDTFPLRGLDGTYRWFLSRALPIRDAEGRIVRWFGTNTDITELREIQASLRESEERLRLAQQAGKIGVFEWNMRTGVNTWTKELESMYGLPPGGFPRTQGAWESLVHSEDRPFALERVKHSIDTSEPGEAEFRVVWPDGSTHWLAGRWRIFNDEMGSPLCLRGINIDITARKQAENTLLERDRALMAVNDALKNQTSALAGINKELESFSYSVSHDLRAPLRTIAAFNHILEEDHSPHLNDDARRCVSIVHKAAIEAGQLIDDLLEFSRLGRQGLTVDAVSMTELAQEAIGELKILQQDRKIDMLVVDVPPCKGDRRLLKLVWANLIENAVKYTKYRQEARIEVGWMPDDASAETVTYYVKDDGVGFDMKYAHKLFGVFHRLHKKEDFDGTGVGLAIVQRIVQRHGGRVWGEGTVDGGATFFFSLRKAKA